MFDKNQQVLAHAKNSIDTAVELASASFDSVEKLAKIQLEHSRQILDNTAKEVKELTSVTDPKEIFDRVNQLTLDNLQKNMASVKNVYAVVGEMQTKISKIAEERMKDVQQSVLKSAEQFNPTGANNMAADTLKNWLNGTNQALNALNKISSQFSEFANKNFEAFHNSEAKPTKQSTKK